MLKRQILLPCKTWIWNTFLFRAIKKMTKFWQILKFRIFHRSLPRIRNFSLLHRPEYIIFRIEFLHAGTTHHYLHVRFFSEFLKTSKRRFQKTSSTDDGLQIEALGRPIRHFGAWAAQITDPNISGSHTITLHSSLTQQQQERRPTHRRGADGKPTTAPTEDRWQLKRICSRRSHRRRGRRYRWTWPSWWSACSPRTPNAPAWPPCARSGAPPRGSSFRRHCRCSHSPMAPSITSPTRSPSASLAAASPGTRASAATGLSSHAKMAASW